MHRLAPRLVHCLVPHFAFPRLTSCLMSCLPSCASRLPRISPIAAARGLHLPRPPTSVCIYGCGAVAGAFGLYRDFGVDGRMDVASSQR